MKKNFIISIIIILTLGLIIYTYQKNNNTPATNNLTQTYNDTEKGFSIKYPSDFIVDNNYTYQEFGPDKNISGVKFTIAPSIAAGTNLSSDSYISVENISQVKNCTANIFIDQNVTSSTTTDNGVIYSVASSIGAAAGNRYEETVYAISNSNPCLAVRYFIHYGIIENYPEGMVKEFDKQALIEKFDAIRRSLTVAR